MLGRRLAIVGMVVVGVMLLVSLGAVWAQSGPELTDKEELGKSIFFDENLSIDQNQSCASCHGPEVGFTGPVSATNAHGAVYEGSISGRFGDRKPPSAAYATQSPIFHLGKHDTWTGGNFWDGRATGEKLGNPAADQALGPFLNPVEQALPDSSAVVVRVCGSAYKDLFKSVWGVEVCDPGNEEMAYDNIGLSIAAYEASPEVNAFSSKFDMKDKDAKLTKQEQKGKSLFVGKGKCSACHPSNGKQPLFTDFTFDNLGVPKNPENPVYVVAPEFVDAGLGGFLKNDGHEEEVYEDEWGKQKVPTLRNVDLRPSVDFVKAYTHNGYFKTLKGIVHFYNTRDTKDVCPGLYTEAEALDADCWPEPEVAENVNTDELGDLGLTVAEEEAIVAFLKTLSDGWTP
jgi:cytochrome c peroxidase